MFDLMEKIITKGIDIVKGSSGRGVAGTIAASGSGSKSISEHLASQEVNPICLVERKLLEIEEIDNLISRSLVEFIAQYTQMFYRIIADAPDGPVKLTGLLAELDTERDVGRIIANSKSFSGGLESYKYGLPTYSSKKVLEEYHRTPELENIDWTSLQNTLLGDVALENSEDGSGKRDSVNFKIAGGQQGRLNGIDKAGIYPTPIGNISTEGKIATFDLTGTDAKIPKIDVKFRYQCHWVSSMLIEDIVKANIADISLKVRLQMYNFGEITFKELITGSDIVKRQERVRKTNKHELIASVFQGNAQDTAYALATGKVPINRASAVIIISQDTIDRLKNTIKGDISNFKVRQRFFDSTAAQTLIILDEESEMVTTYYRGIKMDNSFPLRRLKRKGDGVGEDLLPLIKALADGNAPRY